MQQSTLKDTVRYLPPADAVAAVDRLGLSPEEFAWLRDHRVWAPIPERLREALREKQEELCKARKNLADPEKSPPGTALYQLSKSAVKWREEELLFLSALPLHAVGLSLPDTVPQPPGVGFWGEYLDFAQEVRGMLRLPKPPGEKKAAARRRMEDLALRAALLCDEEDATPWLPKVRKLGSACFGAVLEKAETKKKDGAPDKNEKEIRNWKAYFEAMLKSAEEKTSTRSTPAPR